MVRRRRNHVAAFSLFSFQDIISCVMGIMILVTLILALEVIDGGEITHVSDVKERLAANRVLISDLQREIERLRVALNHSVARTNALVAIDSEQISTDLEYCEIQKTQMQRRLFEQEVALNDLQTVIRKANSDIDAGNTERQLQLEVAKRQSEKEMDRLKSMVTSDIIVFRDLPTRNIFLVEVTGSGFLVARYGRVEVPVQCRDVTEIGAWLQQTQDLNPALYLIVKPSGVSELETLKFFLQRRNVAFSYTLLKEAARPIDPVKGHIH